MEARSMAPEGLCKMKMGTPFALLRGYFAGTTGSKYQMADGFQRTRFAGGPPITSPCSRAFHGSRALSESSKGSFLNRPLSPHLALKKPQLGATYSISHRIFGIVLAGAIMLPPIAMKFSRLHDV